MGIDKIAQSLGVRSLDEAIGEDATEDDADLEEYGQLVDYKPDGTVEIITSSNENAKELLDDIDAAKGNIAKILKTGQTAFEELIEVAKQSENIQAFQVAANMMETLVQANKEFIDVAEKKRDVKMEDGNAGNAPQETNVTQNNLIVTTDTLLEQLLSKKKS